MTITTALLTYTIITGVCGLASTVYIAGFLLSTESIRSPKFLVRYMHRYLAFSASYMVSFLLTPMVLTEPFLDKFNELLGDSDAKVPLYFALCLPLAYFLYFLEFKFIVWCDARKIRGREKFKNKFKRDFR